VIYLYFDRLAQRFRRAPAPAPASPPALQPVEGE
jgi:hypothetical protein